MCLKWQNSSQYSDLSFCTAVLYALCAGTLSLSQKKVSRQFLRLFIKCSPVDIDSNVHF